MPSDVERVAREQLSTVLDAAPADFDLDVVLADEYGLTSLNKVLFLTALCDELSIELSHFTERDVATMRTLSDVVAILTPYAGKAA